MLNRSLGWPQAVGATRARGSCTPQDVAQNLSLHGCNSARASLRVGYSSNSTWHTEVHNSGIDVDGAEELAPCSGSSFLQSLLGYDKLDSLEAGRSSRAAAITVTVTSAVRLEQRQIDQITRKMRRLTGFRDLKLQNIVDPSLIAGFVICYGSDEAHVIDLSVKGQLAELEERIQTSDQRRAELEPGLSFLH